MFSAELVATAPNVHRCRCGCLYCSASSPFECFGCWYLDSASTFQCARSSVYRAWVGWSVNLPRSVSAQITAGNSGKVTGNGHSLPLTNQTFRDGVPHETRAYAIAKPAHHTVILKQKQQLEKPYQIPEVRRFREKWPLRAQI